MLKRVEMALRIKRLNKEGKVLLTEQGKALVDKIIIKAIK